MIHEGTSMVIKSRTDSRAEEIKGTVVKIDAFESGPNAGRVHKITVRSADNRMIAKFIRNRSQLGGGWINKTHTAQISPRSW